MAPKEKLVYGLIDPRDGKIRYIGRSSTGLARPRAHFKAMRDERDLSHRVRWLRLLQRLNLSYSTRPDLKGKPNPGTRARNSTRAIRLLRSQQAQRAKRLPNGQWMPKSLYLMPS